ncbi:MAG: hypothetical protein ACRELV_16505 [Longimicrobiales bacterium]
MGFFRPSREPRGPDRYLDLKIALFLVGTGLAIAGMATSNSMLIWFAITAIAIGIGLRFV